MPPAVATSHRGRTPSVQRDRQGTAGRPSGYGDFLPLMDRTSVEEVAGHEHTGHEDEQQAQVEAGAVEFNRKVVGIGIAFHGSESAADELHRGEGAKEEHRRDAEGMQRKPTNREDRIVSRRGGDRRSLCHDLFQTDVEFGLAFVALAHHGSLAL